jgi:hypothetical protein
MALNDFKKMSEYDHQSGLGTYNNNTNVFKWVLVTNTFASIDADAVNIGIATLTKVPSAGAYVQDSTLANSAWSRAANVSKLDFDDFAYAADPSNPVTAKTWVCYNDTSANKDIYKVVDMTVDSGVTAADTKLGFNYTVAAAGAGTVTTNV